MQKRGVDHKQKTSEKRNFKKGYDNLQEQRRLRFMQQNKTKVFVV